MKSPRSDQQPRPRGKLNLRDIIARSFGVGPERKKEIYTDISRSASFFDIAYWLQLVFSAGVATLGLVLDSTAVIIGAMLISPLMGPILATGLAFAAGDLILGLRSIINLIFSSFAAILFATLLVSVLPFKELTTEIAARTEPNTLDLVIALFSGAIGSIAICREVRGVVTSIPGVAIAVALMPPLCVAGYGIGVAITLNPSVGMEVARGGGLLFLTNLVAITFTAMLVFFLLHIDTREVRVHIGRWRMEDRESRWLRDLLVHLPVPRQLRMIGSLPGRFLLSIVPVILVLIPLTESLDHLGTEIARKQQQNLITRAATELWQQHYARYAGGEPRSYIGQIVIDEATRGVELQMRVFTSEPYTMAEQNEFQHLVATRLNRSPDSVSIRLIEIPTTRSEVERPVTTSEVELDTEPLAELQQKYIQRIGAVLGGVRLPPPAQPVHHSITIDGDQQVLLTVMYRGPRPMHGDAMILIEEEVRRGMALPTTSVQLIHIPDSLGGLSLDRAGSFPSEADSVILAQAGEILAGIPKLHALVELQATPDETDSLVTRRFNTVAGYLATRWGIDSGRLDMIRLNGTGGTSLRFRQMENND